MGEPNADIIIVGAGISGLVAGVELVTTGKKVIILEAKEKAGGRISTSHDPSFGEPVELGAEFIHGNLERTFHLIKKYKLNKESVRSDFRQEKNGEFKRDQDPIEDSDQLEKKLKDLKEDITVNEFLERNFPNNEKLKISVRKFVEGYDSADPQFASALGLKEEWMNENWEQYRIDGGYEKLISALLNDFFEHGGILHTSAAVNEVYQDSPVKLCTNKQTYFAQKVLITVPLGVLQSEKISFFPPIGEKIQAARQLGFGSVIKFILRFDEPFWEKKVEFTKPVFIISQQKIPTWWTHEKHLAVITGWLGGPDAKTLSSQTDESLIQIALESVQQMFKVSEEEVRSRLKAWKVANWQKDEFSLGAYTYATVNAEQHIDIIKKPINNNIWLAGEALHRESGIGTVEAAISSGLEIAENILKNY